MYTESHNLFNFFSHRLQVLCGRLVSPTVFRSLSYALYLLSLSLSRLHVYPVSLSFLGGLLIVASRLRTDVFAGTSGKRARSCFVSRVVSLSVPFPFRSAAASLAQRMHPVDSVVWQ